MAKVRSLPLGIITRGGDVYGDAGIYSARVLRALIRHERCRVDRDGRSFSLVVFELDGATSKDRYRARVCSCIRKEIRSIDEVGWLDESTIGVLLPITGVEGGRTFARRVVEVLDPGSEALSYDVYDYPDHWLVQFNEDMQASGRSSCADHVEKAFRSGMPAWKRTVDIVGSVICLLILSPMLLLIAVYIRLVSPGKILFRQTRVGFGGKSFTFFKFRTMHERNDPTAHKAYLKELIAGNEPMSKLDEGTDRRIIPGGRFLRKCSLDELPQLVNVLIGNMSLVGPRPCIPYEAAEYSRWHTQRFDMLPGMTGLWQVSGRNRLTFPEMVRLDILYGEKMSLRLDLWILLRTVPTVLEPIVSAVKRRLHRARGSASGVAIRDA